MAIQFESSIEVVGSIDVSGSAYVDSLFIGNQSGQISNKVWFDNGSSNTPGLYFEGGQPKFIIYSSISNIFHDTYHPNADTWTNARTITIGNTGKSVNGSTNVSWTLAEIGAQAALTNPITGTGTTNYLSKFTGSTTLGNSLVYDNGTNVGIGTTSPTALLTLESNSTSPYPGIDIKSTSTYPSGEIRFLDSSGSEVSTIESWSNPAISYLKLHYGYTSALSSTLTLDDGYLYLSTAGSERMRINSAGNVGIGTTNPTENLHIAAGNGPTIKFTPTNPGTYPTHGRIETNAGFLTWAEVTLSGGIVGSRWQFTGPPFISGRGDTYINLHDTNGIDIIVKDSQVVKIEDGGNVGIGTTNPSYKLDVDGTARFGDNQGISLTDDSGSSYVSALTNHLNLRTTRDQDDIYFSTGATTTTKMFIQGDTGNVGIGTTSPNTTLEVDGAISTTTSDYVQGSTGSRLLLETSGSGNTHSYIQAQSSGGTTSNEDLALQLYGGNVGIGTSSPGSKLEVAGDTSSALLTLKSNNGGANNSFMRFYDESNGPSYSVGLDSGDAKFKIAYDSDGDSLTTGTKLVMDTSGNVGIGTTNPVSKLHVEGNVLFNSNLRIGGSNTFKPCTYGAQNGLAVGVSNVLGGIANGIIGYQNTIDCTAEPWNYFGGNFIAGRNNIINNQYSHANAVFGQENTVGDPTSFSNSVAGILVSGVGHSTFGNNSFAFGESCFTDIGAWRSLTGGYDSNNFGGFGSVAIGAGATASTGNNQYAFGTGVTTPTSASAAYGADQFVVGKFNVYSTGGRIHRFAVGNGSSDFSRSNALNVDSFGRTGLGVTAPSYQLQLSSNSAAKPTSSSWTVVSDERVKTNIQDYTTGLTEILQINPKTFDYNGKAGFEETTGNIGIIAQDVQGIMPETINTYEAKLNEDDAEETELFNFDSHPIQFALINAVKELNAKVEALEARIQTLEGN